tara:strand:- start:488 stop:817 length:330 start_codon:yes stop_codon:yes gene_type:complete
MSAYIHSGEHFIPDLDGIAVVYDVYYSVTPARAQTWGQPAESAEVEITRAVLTGPNGARLECPEWLHTVLCPSDDALLAEAGERDETAACDAADFRHELQAELWRGAAE